MQQQEGADNNWMKSGSGRQTTGSKEKALNSATHSKQKNNNKFFGSNNKKDLIELIQNTLPKGSSNRGGSITNKYD